MDNLVVAAVSVRNLVGETEASVDNMQKCVLVSDMLNL